MLTYWSFPASGRSFQCGLIAHPAPGACPLGVIVIYSYGDRMVICIKNVFSTGSCNTDRKGVNKVVEVFMEDLKFV